MAVFVWGAWRSPEGQDVRTAFGRIADLMAAKEVVGVVGEQWFRLAYSKKAALARAVDAEAVRSGRAWRHSRFVGEARWSVLDLWNGGDGDHSISVRAEVHVGVLPQGRVMRSAVHFTLGDTNACEERGTTWLEVVEFTRRIARGLGGTGVVGSTDLFDRAEKVLPPFARGHLFLFATDARPQRERVLIEDWAPVNSWAEFRIADARALFDEFHPRGDRLDIWE